MKVTYIQFYLFQVGNIQGHSLPINKLTFSPSGKELITVSDDHKIKVSIFCSNVKVGIVQEVNVNSTKIVFECTNKIEIYENFS